MGAMVFRKAFTLVELLVVIGIIAVLLSILLPVAAKMKERANRVKCASNLRQIGIALHVYADSNKGQYPRTAYNPRMPGTSCRAEGEWKERWAQNNVRAPLHLLISSRLAHPALFLCPSVDSDFTYTGDRPLEFYTNFCWGPLKKILHYSYANPYAAPPDYPYPDAREYRPPPKVPGNFPVASDRNDALMPEAAPQPSTPAEFRKWNSGNHQRQGQNVLYNDGHVGWADDPRCGINGDNIFFSGSQKHAWPVNLGYPEHKHDCVMVPAGTSWLQVG